MKQFIKRLFCKHTNYVLSGDFIDDSEAYRGGSGKCVKMAKCNSCDKEFKKTWFIFT
jgi:hypothetical protein